MDELLVDSIKNFKSNPNKSLIFIVVLAFVLTFLVVYLNSTENILGRFHRDIYLYLIEALHFNGYVFHEFRYVNILSPLIPFLTSLAFKLGFVSEIPIFVITGVFFFFSIVGMFYLLRLRFDDVFSVVGVCVFCSFTVIMRWAGNGSIDLPSVCLWIWGMYFFIKAMDCNQKFFYLSIPLLVLSVFAKYVTIVTIPLVFVYFVSRGDFVFNLRKYLKNIVGGFLVGLVCTVPFVYFYFTRNVFRIVSSYAKPVYSTGSAVHTVNDFLFYVLNLNEIIFRYHDLVGVLYLLVMFVGVFCSLYCVYRILKCYRCGGNLDLFRGKLSYVFVFVSIVGMVLSFVLTRDYSTTFCVPLFYVFSCIFAVCFNSIVGFYNESGGERYGGFSFDFMMFVWFMSHFVFLSAFLVKTHRYGIAFTPPLAFFITYGFKRIYDFIPEKRGVFKSVFPYIVILVMLVVSFGHLTIDSHDDWVDDEKYVARWMEDNWDLDEVNIWADRPVYSWYLQKDYHYVEDRGDVNNLSVDMLNASVDYYISHEPNLVIPHYPKVMEINSVIFYKCDC